MSSVEQSVATPGREDKVKLFAAEFFNHELKPMAECAIFIEDFEHLPDGFKVRLREGITTDVGVVLLNGVLGILLARKSGKEDFEVVGVRNPSGSPVQFWVDVVRQDDPTTLEFAYSHKPKGVKPLTQWLAESRVGGEIGGAHAA